MFLIQLFRDIVFVYVLKLPLTKSGDGLFIKILLNLKIKIYKHELCTFTLKTLTFNVILYLSYLINIKKKKNYL